MLCREAVPLLHAFADGELEAAASADVAAHAAACGACGRRLADIEELGRLVRLAPYHDAPASLRVRVAATGRRTRVRATLQIAAAVAALVAISTSAFVIVRAVRQRADAALVAEDVLADHVRGMMNGRLVDVVSSSQHTVKPWFAGKLDFSPPVEDLTANGFTLVGGRVDRVRGRPVAALVYRWRLHTISVFIWPGGGAARAGRRTIRGYQIVDWTRGGMTFWAVSDVNASELDELARALSP